MSSPESPITSVQADGSFARTVRDVARLLQEWAPLSLSESWDNTGLLLGDPAAPARRIMTCLTLTVDSVQEAIEERADLVVVHHPIPFKPQSRITTETQTGDFLWRLARAGVCVYSPHTAWDSTSGGINDQIARHLGLTHVKPLLPIKGMPSVDAAGMPIGAGRAGLLSEPLSLDEFARRVSAAIPHCRLRGVRGPASLVRVAIGCGSGGSFLEAAHRAGCDVLLTGEAVYHSCLEAEYFGMAMLMIGHFASERFAMDSLAERLTAALPDVQVWSSRRERDPVVSLSL